MVDLMQITHKYCDDRRNEVFITTYSEAPSDALYYYDTHFDFNCKDFYAVEDKFHIGDFNVKNIFLQCFKDHEYDYMDASKRITNIKDSLYSYVDKKEIWIMMKACRISKKGKNIEASSELEFVKRIIMNRRMFENEKFKKLVEFIDLNGKLYKDNEIKNAIIATIGDKNYTFEVKN